MKHVHMHRRSYAVVSLNGATSRILNCGDSGYVGIHAPNTGRQEHKENLLQSIAGEVAEPRGGGG